MKNYKSSTLKYSTLATANSVVDRAVKAMAIVLGDDEKFWVVTPAESTRLERVGYTVVR